VDADQTAYADTPARPQRAKCCVDSGNICGLNQNIRPVAS